MMSGDLLVVSADLSSSRHESPLAHRGTSKEDDDEDVEAAAAVAEKKRFANVDESLQDYKVRSILNKEKDLLANGGKRVTFNEVILVTPYRLPSTSATEDATEVPDDDDPQRVSLGRRYQSLIVSNATLGEFSMLFLIASSVVLFTSVHICVRLRDLSLPCDGLVALGIASGTLSLLVGLVVLISFRMSKDGKGDAQVLSVVANLMCLLWFVTALALTLAPTSPFFPSNTGFFATWLCFLLSFAISSQVQEAREVAVVLNFFDAKEDKGRSRQLLMSSSAALLSISSSSVACSMATCSGTTVFAITWSVCCFLMSSILLVRWKEINQQIFLRCAIVLAAVSTVGAFVTTIIGPSTTGLGLFSAWLMVFFNWKVLYSKDPRTV